MIKKQNETERVNLDAKENLDLDRFIGTPAEVYVCVREKYIQSERDNPEVGKHSCCPAGGGVYVRVCERQIDRERERES